MKTIIIKNLSTIWDDAAVSLVQMHLAAERGLISRADREGWIRQLGVKIDVQESDVKNSITYTISEREEKGDMAYVGANDRKLHGDKKEGQARKT